MDLLLARLGVLNAQVLPCCHRSRGGEGPQVKAGSEVETCGSMQMTCAASPELAGLWVKGLIGLWGLACLCCPTMLSRLGPERRHTSCASVGF